jgi:hypothetical protein
VLHRLIGNSELFAVFDDSPFGRALGTHGFHQET